MNNLLADIIDSKFESSVLGFLLLAPKRTFSIKELASRLPHTVPLLKQAAIALVQKQVLLMVERGNAKFYYLNPRNLMLAEIRQELRKVEKLWADELFISLKHLGQMEGIYLSGLLVGQPQLPVDILLVGKVNLTKLDKFLKQTNRLLGTELNYSIMTQDEFALRKGTFDRFIKDIFDYDHLVVPVGSGKTDIRSPQVKKPTIAETTPKKVVKKINQTPVKKKPKSLVKKVKKSIKKPLKAKKQTINKIAPKKLTLKKHLKKQPQKQTKVVNKKVRTKKTRSKRVVKKVQSAKKTSKRKK